MSKSFLLTALLIFALLQVIAGLLFWFSMSKTIWNIEATQQNIVNFLQMSASKNASPTAPAKP